VDDGVRVASRNFGRISLNSGYVRSADGCWSRPLRFVRFCPCVGVVAVAARMFSEEQLEQLRSFPDIGRDDLIRYFTLTQADVGFVDPGRGRGPSWRRPRRSA
jgi:hypothetical protein